MHCGIESFHRFGTIFSKTQQWITLDAQEKQESLGSWSPSNLHLYIEGKNPLKVSPAAASWFQRLSINTWFVIEHNNLLLVAKSHSGNESFELFAETHGTAVYFPIRISRQRSKLLNLFEMSENVHGMIRPFKSHKWNYDLRWIHRMRLAFVVSGRKAEMNMNYLEMCVCAMCTVQLSNVTMWFDQNQ